MGAAYVLVAALAIGGTIAYLTSNDSDVNVMTLGNVEIEQIEQERDENGVLVGFTDNKPAYPAVGPIEYAENGVDINGTEYKVFTDDLKNVIDKIVTVKNTGKSPAYIRTIIAIEAPEGDPNDLIHVNVNDDGLSYTSWASVEIDGVDYVYSVFTYDEALNPGEISAPSLMQVFLDSAATNEDCAKFGDTWEILVVSQAVQAAGFDSAVAALNGGFGSPSAINAETGAMLCVDWFSDALAPDFDTWDGTADFSLFGLPKDASNEDISDVELKEDEYIITTSEELAAFAKLVDAGNTFEGKTIKLNTNIDLANQLFDPIGSYRKELSFKGTFDGQGHTISNLSQNTWALNNGYYYGDLGLGLFGLLEDATVKHLVMDGAEISGESAICGTVAAVTHNTTFEDITVKNANVADYQYYSGGIVGWASGKITVNDCKINASTTIAAQWGDFDNSTGGVIGGASGSAEILIKDSTVACRIDAYNDVTSSYQWYAYRRCGMLIGNSGATEVIEGTTYAVAPQLTCENVSVIYGDWANYTYCKFAGTSWPYVRVQEGISNSAYSNPRYGHPTDANGNQVVDDSHVHNEGEDHFILCQFDQLYGGGQGVYGTATHDGVTITYNNK